MKNLAHLAMLPILLAASGCLSGLDLPSLVYIDPDAPQTTSSFMKRGPLPAGMESHFVQLDAALLERPIGDPFLNTELWQQTDPLVSLERKAMLDDNGLRVGQIVGMAPAALHQLLKSERSCINPRRRLVLTGHTVTQLLGPILPRAEFEVQQGKQKIEVGFDQARFCFDVTAVLTKNGRTRLTFTPKVENGEATLPFEPDLAESTWRLKVDRPSRAFKELAWELTVAPNEYLVIGPVLANPNTLGHRAFVQQEANVQRLLILRTSRCQSPEESGEPTLEDMARSQRSPSLAAQAGMTAVRASGQ